MSESVLIQESMQTGVVQLTLNRPASRNALNIELMSALCTTVQHLEADSATRIMILKGADPVFCAGLDLKEAADTEKAAESAEWVARTLKTISRSSLISIALAQGAAYAGGAGLMRACDFVIGMEGLKLCFPEVRRGLVPALVSALMVGQIRESDMKRMMLTAEPFDVQTALDAGLVDQVVTPEHVDEVVSKLVGSLLEGTPEAVRTTKKLIQQMSGTDFETRMQMALDRHKQARGDVEALEGIRQFNEQ